MRNGRVMSLSLLLVPHICELLTGWPVSLTQNICEHLTGLELADSSDRDLPLHIDVFIGLD